MLLLYMCLQQICPSNATYIPRAQLLDVDLWVKYPNIYATSEVFPSMMQLALLYTENDRQI